MREGRRAGCSVRARRPRDRWALVIGEVERLRGGFGRHVLAQVAVDAFALDDERLHREDAIAAAERGGGVVGDLLFRRRF
jgi:hypothetical protein